jgi:hypothetical protein
MMKG